MVLLRQPGKDMDMYPSADILLPHKHASTLPPHLSYRQLHLPEAADIVLLDYGLQDADEVSHLQAR